MASKQTQTAGEAVQDVIELDDFSSLIQRDFKPKNDESATKIQAAVATLAEQALQDSARISDDVFSTIDAMVAEIDRKLSDQTNAIMHHPEFQNLESAWRGLDYLVSGSETGKDLKIRVMNISRKEVSAMFKQYRGAAWDQSPLFKKIYESEFGQLGGEPYGSFVCDFQFDHTAQDLAIMKGLARIGAASHAPILSAASSNLLNMDDWTNIFGLIQLTLWVFASTQHSESLVGAHVFAVLNREELLKTFQVQHSLQTTVASTRNVLRKWQFLTVEKLSYLNWGLWH